ncbi:LADA_0G02344g1_1 [Lachancea dasiensis]|uniref:LADA_0G02344g1_1 n=1 Tax=Lachancea dasiensis TaxID=1072105 RepID=A0A1G4JR68_9SACH|nr:LADA_0G02344g1_1 [Lachancea dasiensis]
MFWTSKSNISSSYSYSSSPTFTVDPWNVHSGRPKSNGSSGTSSKVSVFIFDKKQFENHLLSSGAIKSRSSSRDKQFIQNAYDILRTQVNQLAKLKHPNILGLVEPLEEHSKTFMFVSEYVSCSLESSQDNGSTEASEMLTLSRSSGCGNVITQRGILQISQGLDFIHNRANSVALDLRPASILVNENSDWKLSGLGYLTKLPPGCNTSQYNPDFDPRYPAFMHIPLNYSAPELILDNMLTPRNDYFSLGLLIYFLYHKRHLISCQDYIGDYKEEYSKFEQDLLRLSFDRFFAKLPEKLRPSMSKLMNRDVFSRFDNISEFLDIEFFQDPLVKTLAFLDDLPTKSSQERSVYLSGLLDMLPQFPAQLLQRKFLPVLLHLLDQMCASDVVDSASLNTLVTVILKIGETLSQLSFQEKIYPHLADKESFKCLIDNATTSLIENVAILQQKIKADLFAGEILKPLCTFVFSATSGENSVLLQELLMKRLDVLLQVFDFPTVKNFLLKLLSGLFVKTTSLTVKTACVDSFCTMIERKAIDKFTGVDELLPLLKSMKTREPRILMKTLELLRVLSELVETEQVLVEQLLPLLWDFSLALTLSPNQYAHFIKVINNLGQDVQRKHMERLKSSNGANVNFSKVIENPVPKAEDPDLQASHKIDVPAIVPRAQTGTNRKQIHRPVPKTDLPRTPDTGSSSPLTPHRLKSAVRHSKPAETLKSGNAKYATGIVFNTASPEPLRSEPKRNSAEVDDFDDFVSSTPSLRSAPSPPVSSKISTNTTANLPPGFSMTMQPQKNVSSRHISSQSANESASLL